jgi:hypothetical protein
MTFARLLLEIRRRAAALPDDGRRPEAIERARGSAGTLGSAYVWQRIKQPDIAAKGGRGAASRR